MNKLEKLEWLERLVYTDQLKNTEHIENEYGRALTIFQNHCAIMEDTRYASKVIINLIKKHEDLKKVNEELKEFDILLFAKIFKYSRVIKEYLSYYPQLDKFEWNEKNNHYELTTDDGNYWVIDEKHYDLLMKLKRC